MGQKGKLIGRFQTFGGSVKIIAKTRIWPLTIVSLTYLNQCLHLKSKFFSNSWHYPYPMGTGFKLLIFSRISWNKGLDTIGFSKPEQQNCLKQHPQALYYQNPVPLLRFIWEIRVKISSGI
jgi:hypothetical protein